MKPRHEASVEPLPELRSVQAELARLADELTRLQRSAHQLALLRAEERDGPARIEQLAGVLDFERVDRHLEAALASAILEDRPVPHLIASDVLPSAVYDALVGAIPAPVFFERRGAHEEELLLPPRLAPSRAIVAWMFLTEVVLRSVSARLIARFRGPLSAYAHAMFPALPPFEQWNVEITLSRGRLVRRCRGDSRSATPDREWDLMTGVLDLARPSDSDEFGSRLLCEPGEPAHAQPREKTVPFRANSLLVFVGPLRAHEYIAIPPNATPELERYTYEFGIGPTRDARRTLLARDAPPAFAEDAV